MFSSKVIAIWSSLNMEQRASLMASYFSSSSGWTVPNAWDFTSKEQHLTDPVNIVIAKKINAETAGIQSLD
jgi:hypothetical protein